jgi:hypothetical protein
MFKFSLQFKSTELFTMFNNRVQHMQLQQMIEKRHLAPAGYLVLYITNHSYLYTKWYMLS